MAIAMHYMHGSHPANKTKTVDRADFLSVFSDTNFELREIDFKIRSIAYDS